MKKIVIIVLCITVTIGIIGIPEKTEAATCNHEWVEVFEEDPVTVRVWETHNQDVLSPKDGIITSASFYYVSTFRIPILSRSLFYELGDGFGGTAYGCSPIVTKIMNTLGIQQLSSKYEYDYYGPLFYITKGFPITIFDSSYQGTTGTRFYAFTGKYRCTKCGAMK